MSACAPAGGGGGASDDPSPQRLGPAGLAFDAGVLPVPARADEAAGVGIEVAREEREDLRRRPAAVERFDERLDDRDRSVVRRGVTPALEPVRGRDEPAGVRRGLVLVLADVHDVAHLRQAPAEVQVGGRGVGRVLFDHHQRVDGAPIHLLGERGEILLRVPGADARGRDGPRRLRAREHPAQEVAEHVDGGRLLGAHGDHAPPGRVPQIRGHRVERGVGLAAQAGEGRGERRGEVRAGRSGGDLRGEVGRGEGDGARLPPEAMIGHGAGRRGHRLDHVEAAHVGGGGGRAAPRGPLARVAQGEGPAPQEVVADREDDVGVAEVVDGLGRRAEGDPGALGDARAVGRGVDGEAGRREAGADPVHEVADERRPRGPEEEAEARAPVGAGGAEAGAEDLPGGRGVPGGAQGPRPIGIVEAEDGGLLERACRAQAGGVIGVALDLGGAPLVALHQHPGGEAVQHEARGVGPRDPRGGVPRGPRIRQDVLSPHPGAAAEPGQRHAGGHLLQPLPAIRRGREIRLWGREREVPATARGHDTCLPSGGRWCSGSGCGSPAASPARGRALPVVPPPTSPCWSPPREV